MVSFKNHLIARMELQRKKLIKTSDNWYSIGLILVDGVIDFYQSSHRDCSGDHCVDEEQYFH